MQTREYYHKEPAQLQAEVTPIKELQRKQSKGLFLTKEEKVRLTRYAEATRKERANSKKTC